MEKFTFRFGRNSHVNIPDLLHVLNIYYLPINIHSHYDTIVYFSFLFLFLIFFNI